MVMTSARDAIGGISIDNSRSNEENSPCERFQAQLGQRGIEKNGMRKGTDGIR